MNKNVSDLIQQITARVAPSNMDETALTPEGYNLCVPAGIHNPTRGRSAQKMRKAIDLFPPRAHDRVLEIGTGTGYLALHMARAHHITDFVATDIDPVATKNARHNLDQNGVTNGQVQLSDLFAQVDGIFDYIIFNAPTYHPCLHTQADQRGMGPLWDITGTLKQRFLSAATTHLSPTGKILLMYSRYIDYDSLAQIDLSSYDQHRLYVSEDSLSEAGVLLLTPAPTT